MFTDIVGYTKMMQTDEDQGLRLGEYYRKTLEQKTSQYNGKVLKLYGDGSLIIFESIIEAIRCAVEIQKGMVERNRDVPENRRILFRVGINVGDVVVPDQWAMY